MVVHNEMKHINCTMIMPYELGLVFEKKNLDIQKMVKDNKSMCVQKKDSPEIVTIWMIRSSKKLQTRTICEASIQFTVTDGEWKVTHFNSNHNHELTKPEDRKSVV